VVRVSERAIFGDPPLVIVLGVLAVLACEGVCVSSGALGSKRRGKFLVVDAAYEWASDGMGLCDDFDFDTEIVRSPLRHGDCPEGSNFEL
jgi:hypothetical protein